MFHKFRVSWIHFLLEYLSQQQYQRWKHSKTFDKLQLNRTQMRSVHQHLMGTHVSNSISLFFFFSLFLMSWSSCHNSPVFLDVKSISIKEENKKTVKKLFRSFYWNVLFLFWQEVCRLRTCSTKPKTYSEIRSINTASSCIDDNWQAFSFQFPSWGDIFICSLSKINIFHLFSRRLNRSAVSSWCVSGFYHFQKSLTPSTSRSV